MPTATAISGYALANLGPLTTTFTAPASCATATASRFGLGLMAGAFLGSLRSEECGFGRYMYTSDDTACFPSASAHNDDLLSAWDDPSGRNWPLHYYSPADTCPFGWTTVGAVTKDANGKGSTSFEMDPMIGSVFFMEQNFFNTEAVHMGGMFPVSAWADALVAGETGIACCPSGYSANPQAQCYSGAPLSLYTATTACEVYRALKDDAARTTHTELVTLFGETTTALMLSWGGDAEITTKTVRHTFSDLEQVSAITNPEGIRVGGGLLSHTVVFVEEMILLATRGPGATGVTEVTASTVHASAPTGTEASSDTPGAAVSLRDGLGAKLLAVGFAAVTAGGLLATMAGSILAI